MKRKLGALLACAVLTGALTYGAAAADATGVRAEVRPDYTIVVEGVTRTFYNVSGTTVYPVVYDGTTYLPVRAIGELMDKDVLWDESSKTVTLRGPRTAAAATGTSGQKPGVSTVSAEVRPDFTIVVDGSARSFRDANGKAVYALLYNGSTYLPVRAIGELMDKTVRWDNATKTITLGASSGTVTDADGTGGGSSSGTSGTGGQTGTSEDIGLARAKEIALNHAGLKASDVTFVKGERDYDDGRLVYEVEFYTSGKEYDYEIDGRTGTILSYDYEAESYAGGQGTTISEQAAKKIALDRVPGATASHIRIKLDYDDGRAVYEGKIIFGGVEYEFEIDASTGAVREWDVDHDD